MRGAISDVDYTHVFTDPAYSITTIISLEHADKRDRELHSSR